MSDFDDEIGFTSCPNCHRGYDEIDIDYQICSKCGYDAENKKFKSGVKRQPTDMEYQSGEADILTGKFN